MKFKYYLFIESKQSLKDLQTEYDELKAQLESLRKKGHHDLEMDSIRSKMGILRVAIVTYK
jgi:hypothetical protein